MKNSLSSDIATARKATEVDGFIDRFIWEPVAMLFSKIFIKLKIVPNAITIISLVIGIAGGILFYFNNIKLNLIGIILFFMSAVFDTCDGQVARLTNNHSAMGRVLDGFCDTVVEISFYLAITCRLMSECIPFTDIEWGLFIWPIAIYTGLCAHRRQCYMADYYRNLHLFFLNNQHGSEFTRSKSLEEPDQSQSFFIRLYHRIYKDYTKKQEKHSPKLQMLFDKIEENNNVIDEDMRNAFLTESRKYIEYTSILTYNLRTFALFVAVALGLHIWFYVFVLTVLEALCFRMINRYEKLAGNLYIKYYGENK